jgi:hypothetical protein
MILYFSNSLSAKDFAISDLTFQNHSNNSLLLNFKNTFIFSTQSFIVKGIQFSAWSSA